MPRDGELARVEHEHVGIPCRSSSTTSVPASVKASASHRESSSNTSSGPTWSNVGGTCASNSGDARGSVAGTEPRYAAAALRRSALRG
jgi:hypothetical protein